jgi:hypothetical protein
LTDPAETTAAAPGVQPSDSTNEEVKSPTPALTNEQLLELAAKNPPPQEWYDKPEENLFHPGYHIVASHKYGFSYWNAVAKQFGRRGLATLYTNIEDTADVIVSQEMGNALYSQHISLVIWPADSDIKKDLTDIADASTDDGYETSVSP